MIFQIVCKPWGEVKINLTFTGDGLKWKTSKNEFSDSECPNLEFVHNTGSLQYCKALCLKKSGCTAFNYKKSSTSCVLRRCDLPIVRPVHNRYPDWDGYWQSSCLVSSGPSAGKDCVFPFTYGGTTFSGESKKLTKSPRTKTYWASQEWSNFNYRLCWVGLRRWEPGQAVV